jgi:PIN domain nuclease of toxin-antitoxin system
VADDRRLPPSARVLITEEADEVLFSVASAWEIAIKARTGRLRMPPDLVGFIADQLRLNRFTVLPVRLHDALAVHALADLHKDPFDRLLVAQASNENVPLLTCDKRLRAYPIETRW